MYYLAGLFDGEGSISVEPDYDLSVRITTTSRELADFITGYLELFGARRHEYTRNKKNYYFKFNGNYAYRFLFEIESYLVGKRKQAQLTLEYWKLRERLNQKYLRRAKPKSSLMRLISLFLYSVPKTSDPNSSCLV